MVTRPCHLRELDFTTHCYEYFTDGCKKLLQRMHENSVNNVVVCGGQDSYFPLVDADTVPDANMIMTSIPQRADEKERTGRKRFLRQRGYTHRGASWQSGARPFGPGGFCIRWLRVCDVGPERHPKLG